MSAIFHKVGYILEENANILYALRPRSSDMPIAFPPKKAGSAVADISDIARIIRESEEEARRTGLISTEEAEAELDEQFKQIDADAAAGRIKP
jgi:hypothetical protein